MVKARAWFFALLLPACTDAAPGSGSAAASSDVAPGLSASDFRHAILLAPLDRKLASCKAADQGSDLDAEKEAIKKAHAVCLEQIARPVEDGRLSLHEAKARECIAAVEQRGDAWVGPHALAWNLAPLSACRAVFGPRQAAGDVCTTALECPSQLTCAAGGQAGIIGRCAIETRLEACSPSTLSFGVARRNECLGATPCRIGEEPPLTIADIGSDTARPRAADPTVRFGKITVSEGLPPELVERVLRQQFGEVRTCYGHAQERKAGIKGELKLAIDIRPSGALAALSIVGSSLPDESLSRCVKEVYEKRFSAPSPGGNQVVRVTATIRLGPPDPNDEPYLSPKGELFPRARKHASWPVISTCQSPPARGLYCGAHVDCGVDEYCSSGYVADDPNQCLPRKAAGTRCSQSAECKGRCQRDICVSSCGSG